MSEHHCLLDDPLLDAARIAGTEAARRDPYGSGSGWSNWAANDYVLRQHADEREAFLNAYLAEQERRKSDNP